MLSDFFRSESEEQIRLSRGSNCIPFNAIRDSETVVFHSAQYEHELLMHYLGESGPLESVDECSAPAELSSDFDFYLNEVPSYHYIDPSHSPDGLRENSLNSNDVTFPDDSIYPPAKLESRPDPPSRCPSPKRSRRGRPMKITSTSKMANYARNYREQKKNQLAACEAKIKELTEENKYLREENRRLSEGYARLSQQINSLVKIVENRSHQSHDPLRTPPYNQFIHSDKEFKSDLFDIDELMTFSK
ncbi:hypothetical protein Q1695_013821 [Nippostrongylus brasiliensis]|nr:hypothetical protein Q1695_013821 [Nippostrongylus brasiliensis]